MGECDLEREWFRRAHVCANLKMTVDAGEPLKTQITESEDLQNRGVHKWCSSAAPYTPRIGAEV